MGNDAFDAGCSRSILDGEVRVSVRPGDWTDADAVRGCRAWLPGRAAPGGAAGCRPHAVADVLERIDDVRVHEASMDRRSSRDLEPQPNGARHLEVIEVLGARTNTAVT
jgi:hypothetical protein